MTNETIEIEIRPMAKSDIGAVISIENEVFTDPWPDEAFHEGLTFAEHQFIVAQRDSEVIGYAAYFVQMGEARITNIAVAPDYRRKSIAKKLINYILEIVGKTDCLYIFLDVRPSNQAAIDLYRKFGFEKAYIRPDYYESPPEDAMVMVRRIKE